MEIRKLMDARDMSLAAAGGVRRCIREHFLARGGRAYWRAASERVEVEPTARGAEVSIYQRGVALRYFGGRVRPKPGRKALAIPTEEAPRDTWPYEMPGLVLRPVSRKWPHLVGLLVRKEEPEKAIFRLVDETRHTGDPSVLPSEEEMTEAAVSALRTALK